MCSCFRGRSLLHKRAGQATDSRRDEGLVALLALFMLTARAGWCRTTRRRFDGRSSTRKAACSQGPPLSPCMRPPLSASSVSDDRGRFFLPALPVGEYELSVALGNWSVAVQRQLGDRTLVEVGYLGLNVVGADSSTVINVPEPGPGPIGPRRPVPALSGITAIRWDGYSILHALTLKVDRRLAAGLSVSANYSLSKAIDDASDPGATTHETNLPQDV